MYSPFASCVHGVIKRAPSFIRLYALWSFIIFVHGGHKLFVLKYQVRSIWKVLKCGAGEEWRRTVGPIM
jgi:hypothetical protein